MSTDPNNQAPLGFELTLFGKLPPELQEQITTMVPEEDRPNFRLTCKSLDSIVQPYIPHMITQSEGEVTLQETSRAPVGVMYEQF